MKIDGFYTSDKDSWRDLSRQYYGSDSLIKLDDGYIDFSRSSYDRITTKQPDFTYPLYLKIQRQCRYNEPALASLFFRDDISCVIAQGKPGIAHKTTMDLNDVLLYTVKGKNDIHAAEVMDTVRIMDEDHAIYNSFHRSQWITVMGFVCRYLEKNRKGIFVMHYGILTDGKCIHAAAVDKMMPCEEINAAGTMICHACPLKRDCCNSTKNECIADSTWYRTMMVRFLRIYLSERKVDYGRI